MQNKEVHILNGDALKMQFPKSIEGTLIVIRECLADGDVAGNTVAELIEARIAFFKQAYQVSEESYRNGIQPEFDKIISLPEKTTVNLWFEDDLFCQVHLWFVSYLLVKFTNAKQVYLIRPTTDLHLGFGGMSESELMLAYKNRTKISPSSTNTLTKLWPLYKQRDHEKMMLLADQNLDELPFLKAAIQANAERYPEDGRLGRPEKALIKIKKELNTEDFRAIFKAFIKTEAIYGFGDMQVKRMLSKLEK